MRPLKKEKMATRRFDHYTRSGTDAED